MKWLWRRRRTTDIPNGRTATEQKHLAEGRLADQQKRWTEVHQASDRFAALIERTMRGQT